MEDEAAVIYGLEFQARALTAQSAESEAIRFLVGTQSLRFDNQVHLIDFDDENNVISKSVFLHKCGEIWHISSSLRDREILATVYNKTSESQTELRASIWRLPAEYETERSDDPASSLPRLEPVAHFEAPDTGDYKRVLWQPSGESNEVITVTDNQLILWDLQVSETSVKQVSSACVEGKGQPKLTTGAWSPHHNCTQVATANGTCVRGWDLRSMKQAFTIENAHGQLVRDLDFNPNKQYYVATCGDDCKAKFWDIRKASTPLKVLSDHSHWIWSVRYNHFHDQLVLTSSSDSRVVLTNAMSISSEPYGHLVEDEEGDQDKSGCGEPLKDGVVGTYEEHEDSVYSVAWSAADPWLFASLSYDGRLVINRVPRQTKYKILL